MKLNFLDDYADVDNGEGMKGDPFSGPERRRVLERDDKRGAENRWCETFR